MVNVSGKFSLRWLYKRFFWSVSFLGLLLGIIRWSKGAGFIDVYSVAIRPLWPGHAQKEWIQYGDKLETNIRLRLLENDNYRLREILSLQRSSSAERISAAVIARNPKGWWQKLEINKGLNHGIKIGDAVVGPGGLLGLVHSATPLTSRVQLLTAPGNKIGVLVERTRTHGILTGMGTNRPKLTLLDKSKKVNPGDVVVTSPASTLLPSNLVVGVIQFVDADALPTPYAIVQLIASPQFIDWVQVIKS